MPVVSDGCTLRKIRTVHKDHRPVIERCRPMRSQGAHCRTGLSQSLWRDLRELRLSAGGYGYSDPATISPYGGGASLRETLTALRYLDISRSCNGHHADARARCLEGLLLGLGLGFSRPGREEGGRRGQGRAGGGRRFPRRVHASVRVDVELVSRARPGRGFSEVASGVLFVA